MKFLKKCVAALMVVGAALGLVHNKSASPQKSAPTQQTSSAEPGVQQSGAQQSGAQQSASASKPSSDPTAADAGVVQDGPPGKKPASKPAPKPQQSSEQKPPQQSAPAQKGAAQDAGSALGDLPVASVAPKQAPQQQQQAVVDTDALESADEAKAAQAGALTMQQLADEDLASAPVVASSSVQAGASQAQIPSGDQQTTVIENPGLTPPPVQSFTPPPQSVGILSAFDNGQQQQASPPVQSTSGSLPLPQTGSQQKLPSQQQQSPPAQQQSPPVQKSAAAAG